MLKYLKLDEAGGEGGSGGETKWFDGLPGTMVATESVQNSPDLETFVKQALDTASHVGNSIRIPGPDAGEDVTADFHKKLVEKVPGMYYMPGEADVDAQKALFQKLGKPGSPEGYEIVSPEGATDLDKQLSAKFVQWADNLNLTKAQAQGLFKEWGAFQTEGQEAFKKYNSDSLTHLKAEWGAAFDQKMAGVNALVNKTNAPDSFKAAIKDGGIDGPTIKWMSQVADGLMSGESVILNQDGGSSNIMTPAEARAQIGELMNRKEYWEEGNPAQQGLKNKMMELMKLADPTASTEAPVRAGLGFANE